MAEPELPEPKPKPLVEHTPGRCLLCPNPVDKNDPKTWKQVTGFVGGPKKDSMRLRTDTGYYAHDECVEKAASGQPADQGQFDF
jgi:hypothetical protein